MMQRRIHTVYGSLAVRNKLVSVATRYAAGTVFAFFAAGCVWTGSGIYSLGFYEHDGNGELCYAYGTANVLGVWLFILPPICFIDAELSMMSLDSDTVEKKEAHSAVALVNPMVPTVLWGDQSENMNSTVEHLFSENYQKADDPVSYGGYIYKTIFPEYMQNGQSSDFELSGRLQKCASFWGIFSHKQYEIPAGGNAVVVRQSEEDGQEQAVLSIFSDGSFSKIRNP